MCPRGCASNQGDMWAIVLQGGNTCDADKELLINRTATLIQLTFFPDPLLILPSPYKKVGLKWDVKVVFESTQPAFSDQGYLNKVRRKMQYYLGVPDTALPVELCIQFNWLNWCHLPLWCNQWFPACGNWPRNDKSVRVPFLTPILVEVSFIGFHSISQGVLYGNLH